MKNSKLKSRLRRKARIRSKIHGTIKRPRLVVHKSLLYTYAQLIDDDKGTTLASSSDLRIKGKAKKIEKAKNIGLKIAKIAKEKNIEKVVFDRGGYKYHGRIKAVAEGAREGGLQF